MKSNFVEPISHAPASFTGGNTTLSSDNLLNSCDVEGKKSNKVECMDINEFGSDDTVLVDELPDHGCLSKDEIPRVGMRSKHLKLAQEFYAIYAKKIGFISNIRNTNYDRRTKEQISQSIHCNRESYNSNFVEPISHAPASFTGGNTTLSSDNLLNSCDVEGKKSNKLPDHGCLSKDEIPRVGMQSKHLKLAQEFYAIYAKKSVS
ncbi:hypothetical protein Ahy_A01g004246 [Arachis hypogaea]|uniref:FAR1 domain-containing protein n=1 Tax=Arachis hypogaea TaxID=3818 RepID=A0A445EVA3_ARAHY|nr:hypothetical protein Ahy_A01g004246 [Arachis hypogaea]